MVLDCASSVIVQAFPPLMRLGDGWGVKLTHRDMEKIVPETKLPVRSMGRVELEVHSKLLFIDWERISKKLEKRFY
jgi:hypothetical protein